MRIIEDEYTSLHVYEAIVGPHHQVRQDLVNLERTIAWLEQGNAKYALEALGFVGTNGYAAIQSRELFEYDLLTFDPNYENISWMAEAQFPPMLDLYDVWHSIDAKDQAGISDFSAEIAELSSHVPSEIAVYRERIDQLTGTLNDAAAQLEAVTACGE